MNRFIVIPCVVVVTICGIGMSRSCGSDTEIQEQLCTRLLKTADSPGTFRAASNSCIQAAVGHKERADRAAGSRRQHELLFEAAFMVLAAQAESHAETRTRAVNYLLRQETSRALFEHVRFRLLSKRMLHAC